MKKAQTAMEYLMTYGWAIIIVIIVAGALYALGVFTPATYVGPAATGFSGFSVPTGGWKFDTAGSLTLILKNAVGSSINITDMSATYGATSSSTVSPSLPVTLAPNGQQTFTITGLGSPSAGATYSISVNLTYTNLDTGITGFRSSGSLTGAVS